MARGALRTLDTMRPGAPGEPGSPGNNVASVTQPATHSLWLRAAIVIVAGLLAYSNSFSGPFIFDDEITIVENSQIRDLTHLTVLSAEREVPTAGRPLVNLSFALNYAVGGLNVTGYHAVNLALHLLCALLLFGLVHRIVTMSHAGGGRFSGINLAFATGLVWVVHPLNTEAVNYVTQRTELMMALFYLLTLYASVRAASRRSADWWTAVAIVSCAAGMASKESMATAPLMVVLVDWIFLFDSMSDAWRRRWRLYVGLAATWLVLAALVWNGPRMHSAGFATAVSPWTYLLNQSMMIVRYLRLAVWPLSLVNQYGAPVPVSLVDVSPFALFLSVLLITTIVGLFSYPQLGFLGAWFFLTLAPTSSIVPIATEVGAERRMYLPLISLVILGVFFVNRLRIVRRMPASAGAVVLLIISVALGAATFVRNLEYASPVVLAETSVDRYPSGVGYQALGDVLSRAGRHDEAIDALRRAVLDNPRAHFSLGTELLNQGKLDEALAELQEFLREEPMLLEAVNARQAMATIYRRRSQWPEAIEQAQRVLSMKPSLELRAAAEGVLGDAYHAQEKYSDAATHYGNYLTLQPHDALAVTRLAISLLAAGRSDEAVAEFQRAVDLAPTNGEFQRNLANVHFDRREAEKAVGPARKAVDLRPTDPAVHELLGRILAVQGALPESKVEFERVLKLDPANGDAREDLRKLDLLAPKPR